MELFNFFRGLLAWMATVSILLPVSIPMTALGYKSRFGHKTIDIEPGELWFRAGLTAFMLALASAAFVWLDWILADSFDFPPGMVHMVVVLAYLPAGVWITTYFLGFSDLFDGLGAYTLAMFLPVLALYLVNAALDLNLIKFASDWLKPVL